MFLITWLWLSGYPLLIFLLPFLVVNGLFSDPEPFHQYPSAFVLALCAYNIPENYQLLQVSAWTLAFPRGLLVP